LKGFLQEPAGLTSPAPQAQRFQVLGFPAQNLESSTPIAEGGRQAAISNARQNFRWLNYEVARAGVKSEHKLGPMETNTKQAQGLFVILPKKGVDTNIGSPYAGSYYYYSGSGDYLDNFMYKAFDLPAASSLTAKVKYNMRRRIRACLLRCAPLGSSTTCTSTPAGPSVARLPFMPVCAASLRNLVRNAGEDLST
jgi:hypothetical protein